MTSRNPPSVRRRELEGQLSTGEDHRSDRLSKTGLASRSMDTLNSLVRHAVRHSLVILGILMLAACRIAKPNGGEPGAPTDATGQPGGVRPPATATKRPEPGSTTPPSSPWPVASPTPSTTATPVDTATHPPEAGSAKLEHQLAAPYDQALRSGFQSDDDELPNATRYHLDLELDVEKGRLLGHQQISYTNTETLPLDALYLRLFPNTSGYGGEMTVSSLALNGGRVEPTTELEGSALRVPLNPALAPGTRADLTLDFTVALPSDRPVPDSRASSDGYRQLGIYEGVTALANAYPIIPVYDDEGWNVELAPSYGDAVFSDAAFFDVSITAPQTMTLAASGSCAITDSGAAQSAWSCVAAPMRDFNALLGEAYRVESCDVDSIAVNSVFYAGHEEGGVAALDYASRAVRLFDARVGPYPFAELDIVESPTLAGGIEYPGLVVINQSYYASGQGGSDRMEWVVVHEVLHQWWYSLVGNDQVDEPWLDEALVQYCTLLYYEEQYGQDVAERLLERVFQQPYQELQETGRDQPAGLPVAEYSSSDYGPVVYQKGPLYFHDLRQEVGTEAFWRILATYFERHRYAIARPEDWLAVVEAVTGSEHRSLYDQWIQETGN